MQLRTMILLLAVLAATGTGLIRAQNPVGVAYYDVERLYDTLPALFYNDEDYTPYGRCGWNTERYRRKIAQTAAVIDSMRMPLTALCGVENEQVVRDISAACRGGYCYLHRTLNTLDGLDMALLYYGDLFYPEYVEEGSECLYVEGVLRGERIGILISRSERSSAWFVRDLREERPEVNLLVAGRCGSVDCAAFGLHDVMARAERSGRGNVRSRGAWRMRDRILADTALRTTAGDVFARRYLVDPATGYPLPTFERKRYRGGSGYALPVFVYIR